MAVDSMHPGGPRFFGPQGCELFGWFHPGVTGHAAVLLCPPIGHEAEHTDNSYRLLAERLAERGSSVLRFHYHGTGDSAGDDRDPERVAAWLKSIHVAIDELKRLSGATHVKLVGTRLGATLGILAAAERDDVAALALIAPVTSGRRFLREMRAIKLLWAQNHPEIAYAPLQGGDDEAGGYRYSQGTVADLQRLDVLTLSRSPAALVLMIPRDDLSPDDQALVGTLRAVGSLVERLAMSGYSAMQRDMPAPHQLLDVLAAWLEPLPVRTPRKAVHPDVRDTDERMTSISAVRDSSEVVESVRRFHVASQVDPIWAIQTAPGRQQSASSEDVVIIWGRRRGPNRQYVPLARALAANGVTVIRVDLPGLGDSAPRLLDEANDLYRTEALNAAIATLDAIRRELCATRLTLIGLCAAAYLAFQASEHVSAIRRTVLINPPPLYWKRWTPEKFFPRSQSLYWYYRITRSQAKSRSVRSLWDVRRTVVHKLTAKNITGLLQTIAAKTTDPLVRLTRRWTRQASGMATAHRRPGTHSRDALVLFSRCDPGFLVLRERYGITPLDAIHLRKYGIELAFLEADHILLSVAAQEAARAIIVSRLSEPDGYDSGTSPRIGSAAALDRIGENQTSLAGWTVGS